MSPSSSFTPAASTSPPLLRHAAADGLAGAAAGGSSILFLPSLAPPPLRHPAPPPASCAASSSPLRRPAPPPLTGPSSSTPASRAASGILCRLRGPAPPWPLQRPKPRWRRPRGVGPPGHGGARPSSLPNAPPSPTASLRGGLPPRTPALDCRAPTASLALNLRRWRPARGGGNGCATTSLPPRQISPCRSSSSSSQMAPAMADARGHAELGGTAREERPAGAEDGGSGGQRERRTAALREQRTASCAAPASRGTAPRPRGEAEGGRRRRGKLRPGAVASPATRLEF